MIRRLPWAAGLLCAAIALAYAAAPSATFQYDDYNVIVDNPAVHDFSAWYGSMPGIRPLLKLSYTLNWVTGSVAGFHLLNVALHAINATLVLLIGVHLAAGGQEHENRPTAAFLLPLGVALIFALHPAQTEAVTYVSGRSVSMMAVFYLSAILLWLRGAPVWSALLFAAALGTKETAWTLPLAVLILAPFVGIQPREALRRLKLHGWVLFAFIIVVLAVPGYRRLLFNSMSVRPLVDNLLAQIDGVSYLLTRPLLLLQANIDPDIAVPYFWTTELALRAAGLLVLAASGIFGLGSRQRSWRIVGAALLWMFLHLLPTNSVLPRADLANDRQLYLALLGPTVIVVGVLRAHDRAWGRVALAVLALSLAAATFVRNIDYQSEVSLWLATVERSPNKARPWNNLGYAYLLAGDSTAARQAFRRALDIDPTHFRARYNLNSLENGMLLK